MRTLIVTVIGALAWVSGFADRSVVAAQETVPVNKIPETKPTDALQDNLKLTDDLVRPSRQALFHYGNTSSASIWYELELLAEYGNMCGAERSGGAMPPEGQANRRLKRGDRIWQIAFGSGFKCNSAVWKCLKDH